MCGSDSTFPAPVPTGPSSGLRSWLLDAAHDLHGAPPDPSLVLAVLDTAANLLTRADRLARMSDAEALAEFGIRAHDGQRLTARDCESIASGMYAAVNKLLETIASQRRPPAQQTP